MNVALPSIRRDLGFSVQNLQWVLSGYLVTYGGLLLLGARAGDLLGRRRLLAAGTTVFAACSLAGGLAASAGMLIGARPRQGAGRALMAPPASCLVSGTAPGGRNSTSPALSWAPPACCCWSTPWCGRRSTAGPAPARSASSPPSASCSPPSPSPNCAAVTPCSRSPSSAPGGLPRPMSPR